MGFVKPYLQGGASRIAETFRSRRKYGCRIGIGVGKLLIKLNCPCLRLISHALLHRIYRVGLYQQFEDRKAHGANGLSHLTVIRAGTSKSLERVTLALEVSRKA